MKHSLDILEHFERPRNVGTFDKTLPDVGTGVAGTPECGDVIQLQFRVTGDGHIDEARFKTFGCAAAIATSSLLTEWLRGCTLDEASAIEPGRIVTSLSLPEDKQHCAELGVEAVTAAIADFREKHITKTGEVV